MILKDDHTINVFSKENPAAMTVSSPCRLSIETKDCYSNMLRIPENANILISNDLINPATGPIYIHNCQPGDTLKVTIEKIHIENFGVVSCGEDCGPLAKFINGHHLEIMDINDNILDFLGKYQIPIHKMIGVIGVAPAHEPKPTSYPGRHGGNMDCKAITEGTILYLPVEVEGGLLAIGDVHAVMGDGEVGGSGLEIPATVTLTLEVIKYRQADFPIAEDKEYFYIIATAPTLDAATDACLSAVLEFLKDKIDLKLHEIIMLMSLVGDLQVCQVVDPEMTVRFAFPKKYMDRTDF